eukprot:g3939.t1
MSGHNTRSNSEPRERRSYPRDRGHLWNPPAPRNLDADTWRRDPSDPITPQVPPAGSRGREDRDRPRLRNERPTSRDSRGPGGDYRHPNGGRHSGSYRGRGRGRNRTGEPLIMDTSSRYRPHSRYAHPMSVTSQGTQFFTPMNAAMIVDPTKFNANEALAFFEHRWCDVSNDLNNIQLAQNSKPVQYKAQQDSQNGVWGNSKRHVQASMADFLTELKLAIERDQKKLMEAQEQEASQSPKEENSASTEEV